MKRTVTRFFTACFALMLGIGCCSVPANAKVIEPEVVKTESWTTSYYIDDDVDTLYPYIQCEADIYNDGTIKLYMWNTQEWGGSSPIKQNVTFCQYTRDSSKISDSDVDFYRNLLQGDGFFDGSSVHILNPDAENEAVKNKKKVASFSEESFTNMKEYFKTFSNEITDVNKPIEEKTLAKFFELLMNVPKAVDSFNVPSMNSNGYANLDPDKKLEYINTNFVSDYNRWADWWSVVSQFIDTFGNPAYGYSKVLSTKELVKSQTKAVKFFKAVLYNANTDFVNDVDVQVQAVTKDMTFDSIDAAFAISATKSSTLLRNNP